MTEAHSPATPADDPQAATATEPDTATATDEAPAPEPWTAEKVLEWNAYYDLYLVLAVLLLTLLGSINLLTESSVWTHLRAGQELSEHFDPTGDPFSYSQPEARWVHIPWLSDLMHYQVFHFVAGFASNDAPAPAPPPAEGAPAPIERPSPAGEWWGISGITVMDALVRVATALVLLAIRRKGPGLWWSAFCVALALAVVPVPVANPGHVFGIWVLVGGLAGVTVPGAWQWGMLFLCIELLLIFRAFDQGRTRALYGLVPVFLVWANFDETFFYGLVVLAASVIGAAIQGRSRKEAPAESPRLVRTGLIVLAASAAACLVNPSFLKIYPSAIGAVISLPGWAPGPAMALDQSPFASLIQGTPSRDDGSIILFSLLAGVGYLSFLLNARRFSLPRLLVYTAAVVFWGLVRRYMLEFAPVFAAVLALNGQEWYQERFGTGGHLGQGWAFFSTGGRAVMLAALGTVLVCRVVLGWWAIEGEPQLGLGFNQSAFAFEASDLLRDAPVTGNVFNMWLREGDALVWRAYPKRKVFIDSRRHLYRPEVVAKRVAIRDALRQDEVAAWKPLLDEYGITTVMLDANESPNTYQELGKSRNWIKFYDDGDHALFGRADARAEDLAYFRKHEMNVENLAYRSPEPAPSTEKLPRATSALDAPYISRSRINPHTLAAERWMRPSDIARTTAYIADPGRCILSIREARRALYANPNEPLAYLQLANAYSTLLTEESALIRGIEPTAANLTAIANSNPLPSLLPNRVRQLVTALRYAVMTSRPPQSVDDRRGLADLHFRLFQVYMAVNVPDLARENLDLWQRYAQIEDYRPEEYTARTRELQALTAYVDEVQRAVTTLGIEAQANQVQKAMLARQRGAKQMAIQLLEEALQSGVNPAAIKPALLDLYCDVGEPDKAGELWTPGNAADPVLGDPGIPGSAAMRQGRVFLLLGNYESALTVWTREAIPVVRGMRTLAAPEGLRALLRGEPTADARALLEIPEELARQAEWEFEVGMASLEAGHPVDQTADHLTNALKLAPRTAVRPVIAYYLKRLGRPVPELPTDPANTEPAKPGAAKPDAKPDAAKPEAAKPEAKGAAAPK